MSAVGRNRRGTAVFGIATALILITAGCGGTAGNPSAVGSAPAVGDPSAAGGAPAAGSTAQPPASAAEPVGVIAIGHSGLTGENSDPTYPRQDAIENSWATGSSPEVNSVYRRLVAVRPETEGHVAITALGGASVWTLGQQAAAALQSVPVPELVIVQTIDNDIRCDGTDADNVTAFGVALKMALDSITAASPDSKILVVGQLGRPSPSFVAQLVAADPSVKNALTGSGICDFYDEQGNLNQSSFDELTTIIDGYEAEQERVCAAAANCRTDGGLRAAYVDRLENFTDDWAHINVRGQAEEAALIWPVVADFLGVN